MKIGFCQFDVIYKDIKKNLETIEKMIQSTKTDLVVCPELALSGYFFEKKSELVQLSQEDTHQNAIDFLTRVAKENQTTIVIGLSELEENCLYNTAFVIDQTGIVGKHRKINLTTNETIFEAGNQINVFDINGVKIGIAICFETWFPEIFRILVEKGADLICAPSNFGGPWTLDVIKVRALENSIPVVLANRIGAEIIGGTQDYFRGESMIVDQGGNILLKAGDNPYLGVIDIDLKSIQRNENIICKQMDLEINKYKGYINK
jgi:predicted amidohydrolase